MTHVNKKPAVNHNVFYNYMQWRIQDFPGGGAPTPKVGVLTYFCGRKLHKNERIWTKGGCVPGAPLDPPLICVVIVNGKKLIHYPNEISSSMDSIPFSDHNKSKYPKTLRKIQQ